MGLASIFFDILRRQLPTQSRHLDSFAPARSPSHALKSEISDQMSGVSHDVQAGLAQFGEIAADLKYKKARGGAGFM